MITPEFSNKDYIGLNGTSEAQLFHPHFEKWQKWLIKKYKAPENKIAVFIPCAAIKPYFNSPIHKIINKNLEKYQDQIHKIVISNAGVVPYEFSDKYPFNSYDWNPLAESELIKDKYYEVTKNRIFAYLNKYNYTNYVSYLRNNSISFGSLKSACDLLNINLLSKNLDEIIGPDKDSDLVLIYPANLKKLHEILGEVIL